MQTPSALSIANYFIDAAARDRAVLTNMQLLKICYASHGWHLANYGKPLFTDEVQAWKFGPVIPSVYHKFSGRGSEPLRACDKAAGAPKIASSPFLDAMWSAYKGWDPRSLSAATHDAGTPWHQIVVVENHGHVSRHLSISNQKIKKYYELKLASKSVKGL